MRRKGFTLIELLIVIIILGVLLTFAAPQYASTKARALDKEAQATVRLIIAAEKIYFMEQGAYYNPPNNNCTGLDTHQCTIKNANDNLKLSVPVSDGRGWNYTIEAPNVANPANASVCVIASRKTDDGYCWKIYRDATFEDSEPIKSCNCSK